MAAAAAVWNRTAGLGDAAAERQDRQQQLQLQQHLEHLQQQHTQVQQHHQALQQLRQTLQQQHALQQQRKLQLLLVPALHCWLRLRQSLSERSSWWQGAGLLCPWGWLDHLPTTLAASCTDAGGAGSGPQTARSAPSPQQHHHQHHQQQHHQQQQQQWHPGGPGSPTQPLPAGLPWPSPAAQAQASTPTAQAMVAAFLWGPHGQSPRELLRALSMAASAGPSPAHPDVGVLAGHGAQSQQAMRQAAGRMAAQVSHDNP